MNGVPGSDEPAHVEGDPARWPSVEHWIIERIGDRNARFLAVLAVAAASAGGFALIGSDALAIGAGGAVFAVVGHRSSAITVILWASLLRIDHVSTLATRVPDGWRLVGIAFVAYRITVSSPRARAIAPWVALIASTFILRIVFATADGDRTAVVVGVTLMSLLVAATVAVIGERTTLPIFIGVSVGSTATAVAAIVQMTGLARLTSAIEIDLRHPGLAASTTGTTWHLAIGIIALVAVRAQAPGRWRLAVDGALLATSVALVGCGSQGGLVGLALLGLVAVRRGWTPWANPRLALAMAAVAVLAITLAATKAIDGFPPEKGFANDIARFDVAEAALREIGEEPWTGPGFTPFLDVYGIQPHLLPLQLGVGTGVLGVALGSFVIVAIAVRAVDAWRRPERTAMVAAAVLTAVVPWSLVEPGGPIGSDVGLAVLLVSIAMIDPAVAAREGDPLADSARGGTTARRRATDAPLAPR